jgi:leucyl aminopeptidase
VATPTHLAEEAERLGEVVGLEVTVLGPGEMEAEGMGAILAVAQGSEQEPRLIVLEHRGGREGDPPLLLVGKGLTFDAGGISIKPASGMEDMKYDMSGGAAVFGALYAVAELGLPINVVGIVPSSENLLSGRAVKPGDVVRTREGKTVEILNTDAEGRLILADALSYAQTFRPAAMVDCATLTGACVVALGNHASGILGTDEELIQELREAGDRSGERCWPLPLWKEYREQLDSTVADLKNVGGRPAGTITAAAFLKEFVGEVPWAHLDIAGTAYGEGKLSYQRKGGFGVPTRLLVEWVRGRLG